MFLEDILEADGITLLKWKHLCKEQGVNMKGKIPKWFKNLEYKLLADESGKVRKIKNEFIGQSQKENIHVNLFDENEKQDKSSIITWNDKGEFPIFSIDRKRSQSKKYKRIGIHLILVGNHYDLYNSPRLEECKGCYRNININKKKWDINGEGKRTYSYNVIWKIFVLDTKGNINEELIFLANHECNNENEFKLILRSIIVGILLISENSELILGINEKRNF
ncbi:hypothetical protein RhiirA5_438841 [Rhizophagus irregularis]|uniref:Uncharacterized protein n=1 Tax=Rhizophagus irregularis TaxID=588596 RepID=A0A2N0NIK9_9GLOM|nr:hypothetical protein RhiirA5_438841 [Rhizophagus irregularis]